MFSLFSPVCEAFDFSKMIPPDFLANNAFLMSWGDVMESSKSNLSRPRRKGAGLEVNGSPVRRWKTIEVAESKDCRKDAHSSGVGT